MSYDDPFDSLHEATNRLVQQMFPSDEEYQREAQDDRRRQLSCYLRGMRSLVKEDYDGAIREFEEAKRYTYMCAGDKTCDKHINEAKEKKAAIEAERLGITVGELHRREAEQERKETEQRRKAEAAAQFNRGVLAYDNGDYDKAVEAFKQAVEITPNGEYQDRLAKAEAAAVEEAEAKKEAAAEAETRRKAIAIGVTLLGAFIGGISLVVAGVNNDYYYNSGFGDFIFGGILGGIGGHRLWYIKTSNHDVGEGAAQGAITFAIIGAIYGARVGGIIWQASVHTFGLFLGAIGGAILGAIGGSICAAIGRK